MCESQQLTLVFCVCDYHTGMCGLISHNKKNNNNTKKPLFTLHSSAGKTCSKRSYCDSCLIFFFVERLKPLHSHHQHHHKMATGLLYRNSPAQQNRFGFSKNCIEKAYRKQIWHLCEKSPNHRNNGVISVPKC